MIRRAVSTAGVPPDPAPQPPAARTRPSSRAASVAMCANHALMASDVPLEIDGHAVRAVDVRLVKERGYLGYNARDRRTIDFKMVVAGIKNMPPWVSVGGYDVPLAFVAASPPITGRMFLRELSVEPLGGDTFQVSVSADLLDLEVGG